MKRFGNLNFLTAAVFASLLFNPGAAHACSACFGDPNSSMSAGLRWGIFVLLGVVVMVLAGVSTFFVYIGKKASTETDTLPDSTDKV